MKKKLIVILGVLGGLVVMPIWWYLLYKILITVEATELMWFLFWIYVPVGVVIHTLTQIVRNMKDK